MRRCDARDALIATKAVGRTEQHVEPTAVHCPGRPAIDRRQHEHGTREPRATKFEVILSLGLPRPPRWLEFTVEAIFLPFDRDSTPELEFETNLVWLPGERTRGWVG